MKSSIVKSSKTEWHHTQFPVLIQDKNFSGNVYMAVSRMDEKKFKAIKLTGNVGESVSLEYGNYELFNDTLKLSN